jgi:glutamate--cysteine ligase
MTSRLTQLGLVIVLFSMSLDRQQPEAQPISSVDELTELFRASERPASRHQLGLEHEKLIYPVRSATPVAYEGPSGIGQLLARIQRHGYQPFREAPDQPVIALTRSAATISLEPGGQLELSGSPAPSARAVHAENLRHISEVKGACAELGLRIVALGYRPFGTVAEMPWMPKTRYAVMRHTLGSRGRLALDMMLMTATGQISLDWSNEADCIRKAVAVARLSPAMVAMYANSPLINGRPSGWMSYRSHVWTDVDPARCGFLPSMFDGSFSYRAYVEWGLDAPLLFLRRRDKYLQPSMTFRQLLAQGFEGEPALQSDWIDHLSTLFPEVRLKKVIEVRGADCVSAELTGALAALWRGVLYDPLALAEAERLVPKLAYREHLEFAEAARKQGLGGRYGKLHFAELAKSLVEVARAGLMRLDPADAPLLEPLRELVADGRSPAENVLDQWRKDADPVKLLDAFSL